MKHQIRKNLHHVRRAQSVFMQAVVFPAIEDARQAFASFESLPDMQEIEDCTGDCMDFEIAEALFEGR